MLITIHFTVSGRVQGVGFRYHTRNMADALGLSGWVRNMVDGNVEGVAQGDEENLDKFTDWLWRGPRHAKVTSVEFNTIEREQIPGFQITR